MTDRISPQWVNVLTRLFVIVFVYGTAVHAMQLIAGGSSGVYPGAPFMIRWFFVALALLDPLAATLILLRRRIGLVLGSGVLVLDAAANAIVNYPPLSPASGVTTGRVGQGVVTLLALSIVITTPRLWRWYR